MRRPLVACVLLLGCSDPAAAPPPAPRPILPDAAATTGPHHLFPGAGADPTMSAVGEPDRGPEVPLAYALPARSSLVWSEHAYCELDENAPICGTDRPTGLERYRVGRGKGRIVVERLRGTRAATTWVYETAPDGAPVRRLTLGDGRRVSNLLTFRDGTFTSRDRSGANALAGCGRMTVELDSARLIKELRCLQWTGQPMRDEAGIASTVTVRDPRGFATAHLRLGIDGKRVTDRNLVHHVEYELDGVGRAIAARYRGVSTQAAPDADGCHGRRYERDQRGLIVRETCIGDDDKPVASASGVATYASRFDRRGCEVAQRYFGADGVPAVDDDRVHGVDYVRDAQCRELERSCLDLESRPTACGAGEPAREVTKRDAAGRAVTIRHYRADGKPGRDRLYGVFELRKQWDDRDRELAVTCHDPDGDAIDCGNTGFHGARSTYDAAGHEVERRFFAADGQPTHNRGTKLRRFRYDSYDHVIETASGDDHGGAPDFNGASIRRDHYDAYHRRFAVLMFDRRSVPAMFTSCFAGATCPEGGWHAVRVTRRADGRIETNLFFDTDGQLIKTVHCDQVPCFE